MSRRAMSLSKALLALGAVVLIGTIFHADGRFFFAETHLSTLRASSVTGMLAVGATLVILTGGIDLSVGSLLGLGGMLFAALTLQLDVGWPLAVLATIALGACCGAGNGVLAARLGLQPFIATLATMVITRGLAKYLPTLIGQEPGTKVMPRPDEIDGTPFMQFVSGSLIGVPVVGWLFLAVAGAAAAALHFTPYGRHVLAIGGNEPAAHMAGIPVVRTKIVTYVFGGALAGLAATCYAAQSVLGDPEAGQMYELKAIAAVVIGGTALTGGRGGVLPTVVGVLTIGYIEKILSINNVREHWRLIVQGAIIVSAVLLQRRR